MNYSLLKEYFEYTNVIECVMFKTYKAFSQRLNASGAELASQH